MSFSSQFDATINLSLPTHPTGIEDPVLHNALVTIYNALQTLAVGIDGISKGIGIYDFTAVYGQVVNILSTGGVSHVRLASASATPYPALGFCSNLGGVASGSSGEVQARGIIAGLVGLTPGAIYYLSDVTPGGYITTKPVGTGKIVQPIGFALDATKLCFDPTLLYTQL